MGEANFSSCVFVYGTLKQGQCREGAWPFPPGEVNAAHVFGELYDLGAYPAMLPGTDRVHGEIWRFDVDEMESTLQVLDDIEDYHGTPDDLYQRTTVEATILADRQVLTVHTYIYAQPQFLSDSQRVLPSKDGFCRWPNIS